MRVGRVRGVIATLLTLISVLIGVGIWGATPSYAAAPLGTNQLSAFNWFVSQGLSPIAAAGLVGNLDYESAGVNPQASQCGTNEVAPPDAYCGVGIAQWTWGQNSSTTRWQDLVGLAKIHGDSGVSFSTTNPSQFPSLSLQEQFVWQELNTTHRALLAQLESCANVECATYAVQNGYEVPQNSTDENPNPGCATPPGFCSRYADAVAIFRAYALPVQPVGLSFVDANPSAVRLSWRPSERSTGYQILRNGIFVGYTPWPDYVDEGLSPGTSYSYSVRGVNANGASDPSSAVTGTTVPPPPSLAVSHPAVPAVGGLLTFAAVAIGAMSYNYSYLSGIGAAPLRGWSPGTLASGRGGVVRLDLPPNTSTRPATYTVSATATNGSGTSGPGSISVTVEGRTPPRAVARAPKRTSSRLASAFGGVTPWVKTRV